MCMVCAIKQMARETLLETMGQRFVVGEHVALAMSVLEKMYIGVAARLSGEIDDGSFQEFSVDGEWVDPSEVNPSDVVATEQTLVFADFIERVREQEAEEVAIDRTKTILANLLLCFCEAVAFTDEEDKTRTPLDVFLELELEQRLRNQLDQAGINELRAAFARVRAANKAHRGGHDADEAEEVGKQAAADELLKQVDLDAEISKLLGDDNNRKEQ